MKKKSIIITITFILYIISCILILYLTDHIFKGLPVIVIILILLIINNFFDDNSDEERKKRLRRRKKRKMKELERKQKLEKENATK
ncbi:hypothetical protein JP28_12685 [Gallibacterium anatis]|nr:hypothetical protein JP28_12685 [Gallibacterium anatis]KGQ47481.1 hypothetical protein IO46_13195 [Gallibacterium anatis]KGQ53119.1 hypothetical protein IO44_11295 [Gallibacterium anatis str. Avicor]